MVLTTMFVGVSQSLPKTSSIKMVDYWLVFNLMIPFIEVLIHTYEDTLRTDDQEVNHHGRTVTVGGDDKKKDVKIAFSSDSKFKDASGNDYDKKLFSVNEEVQVCIYLLLLCFDVILSVNLSQTKALRSFYKKNKGTNNQDKLRYCQIAAKRIVPIVAFGFVSIYWITGLSLYYFPNLNGATDF